MAMVDVDGSGLRVDLLVLSLHSSDEQIELSRWLCYDNNTINIGTMVFNCVIIIDNS